MSNGGDTILNSEQYPPSIFERITAVSRKMEGIFDQVFPERGPIVPVGDWMPYIESDEMFWIGLKISGTEEIQVYFSTMFLQQTNGKDYDAGSDRTLDVKIPRTSSFFISHTLDQVTLEESLQVKPPQDSKGAPILYSRCQGYWSPVEGYVIPTNTNDLLNTLEVDFRLREGQNPLDVEIQCGLFEDMIVHFEEI